MTPPMGYLGTSAGPSAAAPDQESVSLSASVTTDGATAPSKDGGSEKEGRWGTNGRLSAGNSALQNNDSSAAMRKNYDGDDNDSATSGELEDEMEGSSAYCDSTIERAAATAAQQAFSSRYLSPRQSVENGGKKPLAASNGKNHSQQKAQSGQVDLMDAEHENGKNTENQNGQENTRDSPSPGPPDFAIINYEDDPIEEIDENSRLSTLDNRHHEWEEKKSDPRAEDQGEFVFVPDNNSVAKGSKVQEVEVAASESPMPARSEKHTTNGSTLVAEEKQHPSSPPDVERNLPDKPPEGLTTGQRMTWYARQGRKRKASLRKMNGSASKSPDRTRGGEASAETKQKRISRANVRMNGYDMSFKSDEENDVVESPYPLPAPKRAKTNQETTPNTRESSGPGKNSDKPAKTNQNTTPKVRGNAGANGASDTHAHTKQNTTPKTKGKSGLGDDVVILPPSTVLEGGERVYAKFPPDMAYYWGIITDRTVRKNKLYTYEVFFDDRDIASNLYREAVYTVDDLRGTGFTPPQLPEHQKLCIEKLRKKERLDIADLCRVACSDCENCDRVSCGSCTSCLFRQKTGRPTCCFQKMCCRVPDVLKAQIPKVKGLLPPNYSFVFKEHQSNPDYNGLTLISGGGRTFKSFEAWFNDQASHYSAANFYKYVGLDRNGAPRNNVAPVTDRRAEAQLSVPKPYTPKELLSNRCGRCINCKKPDCLKCASCVRNSKLSHEAECCLQKMCLNIPLERKLQPAEGFPPGWSFAFQTPSNPELQGYQGLVLYSPASKRYFTAENAKNHLNKVLADFDPKVFYLFVGLVSDNSNRTSASQNVAAGQNQKRPPASQSHFQAHPRGARVTADRAPPKGLSLEALYQSRCTDCSMCAKPSCDKCQACIENKSRTSSRKLVCLRKMCSKFSESCKAQPAKGMPEGWRFYFADPKDNASANKKDHDKIGLVLLPPQGSKIKFKSLEAAWARLQGSLGTREEVVKMTSVFYNYIGCDIAESLTHTAETDLVGKPFCQRWTALDGRTKILYGTIEACHDDGEARSFTVRCSEESRALVNASESRIGSFIPETEMFSESLALGGCMQADARDETKLGKYDIPVHWITPDMRHEDFEIDEDGSRNPRLKLHVRGFELVFRAKQSTKPNAGKGVFVSCKSLTGAKVLELQPGELLDIGIYAPFRCQDKKHHCIFSLKNLIHSLRCEEWCFNLRGGIDDEIFDITEDRTGDLHEIARRHIPAYVNETNTDAGEIASVYADHDPEGCVHYLIGHRFEAQGPFHLFAGGPETEIFIDYGAEYEKVRLRKNYSRLSDKEARAKRLELEQEEAEYFEALQEYNTVQINNSLHFIHRICKPEEPLDKTAAERALLATLVLHSRAKSILRETIFDNNSFSGDVQNSNATVTIEQVVGKAKKLVKYLYGFWWNNPSGLQQSLLSEDVYEAVLKDVFGDHDFRHMKPEEFSTRIMRADEDEYY